MRALFGLFAVALFCSACGVTPRANPGSDEFRPADLDLWRSAITEGPEALVGVWRLSDANLKDSESAFRFDDDGIFASGTEEELLSEEGIPEWQGAYRIEDDKIVCHYQIFRGSREWSAPNGQGQLAVYPFVLRDADTLDMGGQTRMKLIMRFRRLR